MSLQSRLSSLITAIGADIKDLRTAKAFRVYLSANTAYGDGVVIKFDTETGNGFDPLNWYDPATGKFQPNKAGKYQILAAFVVVSGMSSGQYVELRFYKNGAIYSRGGRSYFSGGNPNVIGSDIISLNGTTDYVQVIHTASTARNDTLEGVNYATYFAGYYIGS